MRSSAGDVIITEHAFHDWDEWFPIDKLLHERKSVSQSTDFLVRFGKHPVLKIIIHLLPHPRRLPSALPVLHFNYLRVEVGVFQTSQAIFIAFPDAQEDDEFGITASGEDLIVRRVAKRND